jgi:hypothetical protein
LPRAHRRKARGFSRAFVAHQWGSIRGRNVIVNGTQSAGTLRNPAVEIEQFRFVVSELIRGAGQLTASSLVQPRRRLTT